MADYIEEMRRLVVRQWLAEEERSIAWLARRVGYTREYLTNVLNGRYPFTDKLVHALSDRVEIDFGNAGVNETEGHLEAAALAMA